MTNVEHEAEELIASFGVAFPIDPQVICNRITSDSFKIEYREEPFQAKHICGISIGDQQAAQIVVNSNILNPKRRLFTSAHEIGHVILHIQRGKKSNFQCTDADIRETENQEKSLEIEANKFASALLMPKKLIQEKVNKNDLTWNLILDNQVF